MKTIGFLYYLKLSDFYQKKINLKDGSGHIKVMGGQSERAVVMKRKREHGILRKITKPLEMKVFMFRKNDRQTEGPS